MPKGECILSYCLSAHVLTSIASVASTLYIIKLLYISTVSMVTDAIMLYMIGGGKILMVAPSSQPALWVSE